LGAANWVGVRHLWNDLPEFKNSLLASDKGSFIGDKIWIKGIKLRFHFANSYAATTPVQTNWRVSICSTVHGEDPASLDGSTIPTPWYDNIASTVPFPHRPFNMQKIKILKCWNIRTNFANGVKDQYLVKKMWVRFNRTFAHQSDMSNVVNNTWGRNVNRDYFVIVEGYKTSNTDIAAGQTVNMQRSVYFKDM